jgi:hypothetical protein
MAWICPIVVTFGSPRLSFSEGYTHRVAISNRRLVAADDDAIAFRWKDYRVNGPGPGRRCGFTRTSSSGVS